jgi:hypothetical protein
VCKTRNVIKSCHWHVPTGLQYCKNLDNQSKVVTSVTANGHMFASCDVSLQLGLFALV